jgi:type I restriction enzyme M protein
LGSALGGLGLAGPAQKAVWSALAIRDEDAPIIADRKGNPEPDPELRDNENVPLPPVPVSFAEDPTERFATLEYRTAIDDYMRDEVMPYVADAWVDHDRTRIGYEIPLTRHFYKYVPPRPLVVHPASSRPGSGILLPVSKFLPTSSARMGADDGSEGRRQAS